jgi:hypothetical protein
VDVFANEEREKEKGPEGGREWGKGGSGRKSAGRERERECWRKTSLFLPFSLSLSLSLIFFLWLLIYNKKPKITPKIHKNTPNPE